MAVALTTRRFTVEEYHRMAEVGILTDEDRVELIDGEIVEMTPIGFQHARCVIYLTEVFVRRLEGRAVVSPQGPLAIEGATQLQPDLVLLRPPLVRLPSPADALLVVEAADTSLERDRGVKLPRYAGAGVPEVWIVDFAGEAVEMYRVPSSDGYRNVVRVPRGGSLSPVAFPDLTLGVDEILGPRQA